MEVEAAEAVVRDVFDMDVPGDGPEDSDDHDPPAMRGRR